ncbi:MAG TPA: response regulator [Phycisphaerae bacterium]|nr:response regulator [Phycisphaerales bacterium]HRX86811.1 response regulator [Phycisphaerae bacterium]
MLDGVRVLIVEDWLPLAIEAKDRLETAGAHVVGPVGRLARALELAEQAEFDVALLDIDLNGERVFPVANILQVRGIPFILMTGFGSSGLPADLNGHRVLEKPFDYDELASRIASVVT